MYVKGIAIFMKAINDALAGGGEAGGGGGGGGGGC